MTTDLTFSQGRKYNRRELVTVQGDQIMHSTVEFECMGCFHWYSPNLMDTSIPRAMLCRRCVDS